MKKKIYVYLFDGYSDWEIAYLTPEINKSDNHQLIYLAADGHSVTSMGGLHVKPTSLPEEIDARAVDLLILPGGEAWERKEMAAIGKLVRELDNREQPMAAICAATTFLGKAGMLDTIKHTSNDLNYLQAIAPAYRGQRHYQHTLAVTDKNIITANGIAPIEFAREVFKMIDLYDEANLEKWFQLFKNGIWDQGN